jgi:aryl-alcohol dehydrogenase-like predicted oxidoreductase
MPQEMPRRKLGSILVSEIGFGGWAIGGNEHGNSLGPTDDAASRAAIERALELGVNFFDTADCYGWGRSESLLGETLGARRKDVLIATKVGGDFYHGPMHKNYAPEYIRDAFEKSLGRLGTDYVDLYQLHDPPSDAIRDEGVQRAMRRLRESGAARAIGVSIHTLEEAHAALDAGCYESIQIAYSVAFQYVPNRFLDDARARGIGVIAREPLAQGFLSGKYAADHSFEPGDVRAAWPIEHKRYLASLAGKMREYFIEKRKSRKSLAEIALQFPLAHPAVATVIVSMKSAEQAERNCRAAHLPPLDRKELAWLRE